MTWGLNLPHIQRKFDRQDKRIYELERKLKVNSLGKPPFDAVGEGGGGAGMFTLLVAASDASAASKARADYVCDGTNDQVQIAAALASTAGGNNGRGTVWLSEGTFVVITLQYTSGTTWGNCALRGMGIDATTLLHDAPTGADFALYNPWDRFTLSDMTIDAGQVTNGGYGVYISGDFNYVERVRFYSVGKQNYANLVIGLQGKVRDCEFRDTINAAGGIQGIDDRVSITGCEFENIDSNAMYLGSTIRNRVIGNHVRFDNISGGDTNSVVTGVNSIVLGNIFQGDSATATISAGSGSQVANNVLL